MLTLSRPQIESMEAGRAMDIECARASGWVQVEQLPDGDWAGRSQGNPKRMAEYIPRFSTDLAAAMTLLDGWKGPVDKCRDLEWECCLWDELGTRVVAKATAPTEALSICKAMLFAALEQPEASK